MMHRIRHELEKGIFGVCSWWAERLGIKPSSLRLYFIYAAFASLGSLLLPYLMMAFLLRLREYFRPGRTRIWDL